MIIVTIGDYQKMAKDFGVVDFLSKPINWKKLSANLKKYKSITDSQNILVVDDDSSETTAKGRFKVESYPGQEVESIATALIHELIEKA